MNRILTVVTPAASQDLISLADLKTALGITSNSDDALLAQQITAASAIIARYCNRKFLSEPVTEEVWTDGFTSSIVLSRWPVSPTGFSVTENDVALDATGYRCNFANGTLHRISSGEIIAWGATRILATYTAGYEPEDVPADLQSACKSIVALMRSRDARDPLVKSEEIPGVLITGYWVGSVGSDPLPADVAGVLKPYRRMNV